MNVNMNMYVLGTDFGFLCVVLTANTIGSCSAVLQHFIALPFFTGQWFKTTYTHTLPPFGLSYNNNPGHRISFGRTNDGNSHCIVLQYFYRTCHVNLHASVCSHPINCLGTCSGILPLSPPGIWVHLVMRPKASRNIEANYPGGKHHVSGWLGPPRPGERVAQQTPHWSPCHLLFGLGH